MADSNAGAGANVNVTLIRGADLVAAPWKNGGGATREVAAFPQGASLDAFVWRVSIADVAQPGPFSRFAGIDRTLVLLSGAGMLLDEMQGDGAHAALTHALTKPLDIAQFTGEAAIEARLVDGLTRDFNLMVRRCAATGDVQVWRDPSQHTLNADVALLYCASGNVTLTPGSGQAHTLASGDTLRLDPASGLSCKMEGAGALLAVSIRYTPR